MIIWRLPEIRSYWIMTKGERRALGMSITARPGCYHRKMARALGVPGRCAGSTCHFRRRSLTLGRSVAESVASIASGDPSDNPHHSLPVG